MRIPKTLPGDGIEWRKYIAEDLADEIRQPIRAMEDFKRYNGTVKETVYYLNTLQCSLRIAADELAQIRDQIRDYKD